MPERTERLREAFDAVRHGIAVTDANGLVASWNRAAAQLTGISAIEAIGAPFALPLGTPDAPASFPVDDRWIEVAEAPLPGGGSVIEIDDVSRSRALEAARTMFFASTSHELKTPLTAISGFARVASSSETEAFPRITLRSAWWITASASSRRTPTTCSWRSTREIGR